MESSGAGEVSDQVSTTTGQRKGFWPRLDIESTATLILLAILVGLGTGLAAVAFIKSINWITQFSFVEKQEKRASNSTNLTNLC